jgi:DedD protein
MADTPVSQEQQALRRRARRRLVGAIALALLAVVVLPMLFDPEPKPLGGNVEIRIPSPDTPFESTPPAPGPAIQPPPVEAADQAAAPMAPAPVPADKPAAKAPIALEPAPLPSKPAESKPVPAKPPQTKAEPAAVAKAAKTQEAKPAEPRPAEAKPTEAKPAKAAGEATFYLQLGVFSSEANARRLADKAKAAGFQASVVTGDGQSRVRLGPYAGRDQAVAAQTKLKAKGLSSVVIGR